MLAVILMATLPQAATCFSDAAAADNIFNNPPVFTESPVFEAGGTPALQRGGTQRLSATGLDSAIETVINLPEYTWRMPREKPPAELARNGLLHNFLESVSSLLRKGWQFIKRGLAWVWPYIRDLLERLRLPRMDIKKPDLAWSTPAYIAAYALLAGILTALGFLAWRAWKERPVRAQAVVAAPSPIPDLRAVDVDPGTLSEEDWRTMAEDLLRSGDLRLGLRALYLASLAFLGGAHLITLARFKSDREYERELSRRAHAIPELCQAFGESRALFERIWYGLHEVGPGDIEAFSRNQEVLKSHART